MQTEKTCQDCQTSYVGHHAAKYCPTCREARKKKPTTSSTTPQEAIAEPLSVDSTEPTNGIDQQEITAQIPPESVVLPGDGSNNGLIHRITSHNPPTPEIEVIPDATPSITNRYIEIARS